MKNYLTYGKSCPPSVSHQASATGVRHQVSATAFPPPGCSATGLLRHRLAPRLVFRHRISATGALPVGFRHRVSATGVREKVHRSKRFLYVFKLCRNTLTANVYISNEIAIVCDVVKYCFP